MSFWIMATSKNNWSSKHMEDQFEKVLLNLPREYIVYIIYPYALTYTRLFGYIFIFNIITPWNIFEVYVCIYTSIIASVPFSFSNLTFRCIHFYQAVF